MDRDLWSNYPPPNRKFDDLWSNYPPPNRKFEVSYQEIEKKAILSNNEQVELAEHIFKQPVSKLFIHDYHILYKNTAWIPSLAQFVYVDYNDNEIWLRAGLVRLYDLLQNNELHFFKLTTAGPNPVYQFKYRLKIIIKKVLFIFEILASKADFSKLSLSSMHIRFSSEDSTLIFPRVVLNLSGSSGSGRRKGKSKGSSSTAASSSPKPAFLKVLGDFLFHVINQSTRNIKYIHLNQAEQNFINGLRYNNDWTLPFVRNHPTLWNPMTASRFLVEAHAHVKSVRSRLQLVENGIQFRNDTNRNIEPGISDWVDFWMGLPVNLQGFNCFNNKYKGWANKIKTDIYLNAFYEHSIKKNKYADSVGGLFQFMRNAIVHFHDVDNVSEDIPVVDRFEVTTENVEEKLLDLFPDFFFDVYPNLVSVGFQFEELKEKAETEQAFQ